MERLLQEYREIYGYVSYLKTKKLSRGLTDYESKIYDQKKIELNRINEKIRIEEEKETFKLIYSA